MVQSHFALSWDCYQSNICSGFSSLQQNGDFVDMTLAADGHFVKVHQVLIALASPYLKDLLASTPSQHPIIFLNNVSHATLSLLLQYVYTGEVLVPSYTLSQFVEAAKSLHIRGLENIGNSPEIDKMSSSYTVQVDSKHINTNPIKLLSDDRPQMNQPMTQFSTYAKSGSELNPSVITQVQSIREEQVYYDDDADDTMDHDDFNNDCEDIKTVDKSTTDDKSLASSNLQFTVSIRGSLQVILNRYMYNAHSIQHRTGIRRWRCIDYRNRKCMACVVTKGNVVMNRSNLHNHPFHDKKILGKIEQNAVYSAIDDVEAYKEKKKKGGNTSKESEFDSPFITDDEMSDDAARSSKGSHKRR